MHIAGRILRQLSTLLDTVQWRLLLTTRTSVPSGALLSLL